MRVAGINFQEYIKTARERRYEKIKNIFKTPKNSVYSVYSVYRDTQLLHTNNNKKRIKE